MNRIKLRTWYEKSQTWVYFTIGQFLDNEAQAIYSDLCLQGTPFYQYIGFEDKNGKEVFEYDIEKGYDNKVRYFCWHFNRWILRDKKGRMEEINKMWADYLKYEIIGSVDRNPELLKGVNRIDI